MAMASWVIFERLFRSSGYALFGNFQWRRTGVSKDISRLSVISNKNQRSSS